MGRDVPFKEHKLCDICGELGAYDFMGDYICMDCYSALPDHDNCEPGTCEACYPEGED